MQKFDVCIVGGGASGSALAIMVARQGKKVCVIDKYSEPAKKLLVTGNGRCNITNRNISSEFYNQNIDNFLNEFGYEQTISFFESIGIDIYSDQQGRCYPISNLAKSVQIAIMNQFKKLGIVYCPESEVANIDKIGDCFCITTNVDDISSNKVVIACGINDFSKDMCKKFNVDYCDERPTLVALKTKQNTSRLEGIRLSDVQVRAECNGCIKSEAGEVLFKKQGLSGIVIFNISSIFAKNSCFEGKISINLLKNLTKSQILSNLYSKMDIYENINMLLQSYFSKEIVRELLKRSHIDFGADTTKLSDSQINDIVENIVCFDFDVTGYYDNNQVFAGGVEINKLSSNLECKTKGLYFCGEVCDVDGVCGGYNLQWAWSSAFAVAKDI